MLKKNYPGIANKSSVYSSSCVWKPTAQLTNVSPIQTKPYEFQHENSSQYECIYEFILQTLLGQFIKYALQYT